MFKKFMDTAKKEVANIQAQGSAAMASASKPGGSGGAAPAPPVMEAVAAQIAIFPTFVSGQTQTLVLREKVFSFSGDTFEITNLDKVPVFQVQGKKMSLSGRKVFCDAAGNELFHLRKEHIALHTTYYGEDSAGKKLFEVKSKFAIGKSKAYVNFTDATGKDHSLLMTGNFFDTTSNIVDEATSAVVGTISRKLFNVGEIFGGQQTYTLSVAPGVDAALMAAACICFDEKNNEKK